MFRIKQKHKLRQKTQPVKRVLTKQNTLYIPKKVSTSKPIPYKVITSFFDLQQPCPSQIHNCNEMRQIYKNKINQHISHFKGCSECNLHFIKSLILSQLKLVD